MGGGTFSLVGGAGIDDPTPIIRIVAIPRFIRLNRFRKWCTHRRDHLHFPRLSKRRCWWRQFGKLSSSATVLMPSRRRHRCGWQPRVPFALLAAVTRRTFLQVFIFIGHGVVTKEMET